MPQPVCGRVQVHPRAGPSAARVQDRAVRSVRVHAQAQAGGAARHNLSSRYLVILSLRRLSALSLFFSAHSSSRSLSHQLLQNFPRSHGPLFFQFPNVSFSFSRVAFLTLACHAYFSFRRPLFWHIACSQAGRARDAPRRVGNVQARVWQRAIGGSTEGGERARKALKSRRFDGREFNAKLRLRAGLKMVFHLEIHSRLVISIRATFFHRCPLCFKSHIE